MVEYDGPNYRAWILGRRWHHGATGTIVAATACVGLFAEPRVRLLSLAGLGLGGVLIAHDRNDRARWFARASRPRTSSRIHARWFARASRPRTWSPIRASWFERAARLRT